MEDGRIVGATEAQLATIAELQRKYGTTPPERHDDGNVEIVIWSGVNGHRRLGELLRVDPAGDVDWTSAYQVEDFSEPRGPAHQ